MRERYIIGVRQDKQERYIKKLAVLDDLSRENYLVLSRQEVVQEIKDQLYVYYTALENGSDKYYSREAKVILYKDIYLTTKGNETEGDNLGNLPEF